MSYKPKTSALETVLTYPDAILQAELSARSASSMEDQSFWFGYLAGLQALHAQDLHQHARDLELTPDCYKAGFRAGQALRTTFQPRPKPLG